MANPGAKAQPRSGREGGGGAASTTQPRETQREEGKPQAYRDGRPTAGAIGGAGGTGAAQPEDPMGRVGRDGEPRANAPTHSGREGGGAAGTAQPRAPKGGERVGRTAYPEEYPIASAIRRAGGARCAQPETQWEG